MDYAWRYKAILRALRGGKKKTFAELTRAVGDSDGRMRDTVRRMRNANHATFEKCKIDGRSQGVVSLTTEGEERAKKLHESDMREIENQSAKPQYPKSLKLGGVWPDELERIKKHVKVGDSFQAIYCKVDYKDNPRGGKAIRIVTTKKKTIRVISKHEHFVRTSDGSSSTYFEIAMCYRGEPLDRRE